MKSIRNLLVGALCAGGLIADWQLLHAQETAASASSPSPDSIVQITADAQGLQAMAPAELPRYATFWVMVPGYGSNLLALPYPCLPLTPEDLPVYAITGNEFLVDGTGGQVFPNGTLADRATVTAALELQANTVLNLITRVQTANANQPMQTSATMQADAGAPLPNGVTNLYTPPEIPRPDYGTNLWLAATNLAAGYMSGFLSNSTPDVQYELQWTPDLTEPWQSAGWFVYGSELTNWTAWTVPAISSSNLFLRVRSWQDDGSGLPLWWQQQYGVSDPYGNPAGDGWNNLQKFQNGMDPNQFYTPAAPQGLTVNLNLSSQTATLSWLPSAGAVNGYTVEKTYQHYTWDSPQISYTNLSAGAAPYQDDLSGNIIDTYDGNVYNISYRVQANYQNGSHSSWSVSVPLQVPTVSASIIPGLNGTTILAVSGVPGDAVAVRLAFIDQSAVYLHNDNSFNYIEDIPVSALQNGVYAIPAAWQQPTTDAYGAANENAIFVASVDANTNTSAPNSVGADWSRTPFYDARAQLKQNLIFQLRAAGALASFQYYSNYNGNYLISLAEPTNYAYAGFFDLQDDGGGIYAETPNPSRPFADNYLFRNFVFTPADVNDYGNMTTGANLNQDFAALDAPVEYQFAGDPTNAPALLLTNATRWLLYDATGILYSNVGDWNAGSIGLVTLDSDQDTCSMASGYRNWFGLPYVSVILGYPVFDGSGNPIGLATNILSAGATIPLSPNAVANIANDNNQDIYPETAQPQFQTAEYDFWNPNVWNPATGALAYPLPGNPDFSPTNRSALLIASLADSYFQVAGYAKLAVTNGYPGVYGYLGQYFEAAYTEDANGVATTNSAGYLTPYGNFFATKVGPAALVTMPDPDTGERGTDTVYVVALKLDVNHDGVMDLSYTGADNTTSNRPYVFWVNNNYDRWTIDILSQTNEQEDLSPAEIGGLSGEQAPDCDYTDFAGNRLIPDTRDLEDFARLWVCGVTSNLLTALPPNSIVTLSWGDVTNPNPNNPTIDLFQSAEPDGGTGYLTNEAIAQEQIDIDAHPYIGRLGPGQSIQLNASQFADNWAGNHFIWCGVSNGVGQLTLTIADASDNVLAQASQWIQIEDIKDMYERWTVGDNPNVAPTNTPMPAATDLPDPTQPPFQYTLPTDTNTPYILFVHGWNMQPYGKDRFAETAFKRLYWQGYQGRFGEFRWPTTVQNVNPRAYDNGDDQAWQSGVGLLNFLTNLDAEYQSGNVYLMAHSQGNVVAGEALRLATQKGLGQVVNTYVAMQAAIAAHAYDPSTPDRYTPQYPDDYAQYWTAGAPCYFNGTAGAGTYVNFFNTNDFALTVAWEPDQDAKPDFGYHFDGTNFYYQPFLSKTYFYFPGDTYTIFSYCDPAPCYALGAQPDVGGAFKIGAVYHQVELDTPPYNFGTLHIYHSGEFLSDCAARWQFWNEVLLQMRLTQ